jgi:hypothetical protein
VARTDSGVWVDLSELHQSLGMFGSSLAGSWAGRARLGPRWRPVGPGWARLDSVAPRLGPVGPAVMPGWTMAAPGLGRHTPVCAELQGVWRPVVAVGPEPGGVGNR